MISVALLLFGAGLGVFDHGPVSHFYAAAALILPMALAEYWSSALRAQGSVWTALTPRDIGWRLVTPLAVVGLLVCWRDAQRLGSAAADGAGAGGGAGAAISRRAAARL